MKHGKRDANHAEIRDALRAAYISVFDAGDIGKGYPDLVCGFQGQNYLLEIKTQDGKLTPDQVEFINTWRGTVHIVRTPAEALRVFGVEL